MNFQYKQYVVTGELDFAMTQVGVATRIAAEWSGVLAWCDWLQGGKWIIFGVKPGVWVIDEMQDALGLCTQSAIRHQDYVNFILDQNDADGDHVSYMSYPVMKNIMGFAKGLLSVAYANFDQNPWVLNTPSGPLDLEAGSPMEVEPAEYMCQTRVAPRAMACPLWEKHLDMMCKGDKELIGYLKRLAGMALVGDQNLKAHKSAVLNGLGRNGKGVFTQALLWALGDYGGVASSRLLTAQEGSHTTEQRRLAGKRLVVVEEVKRINPSLFKNLTGGGCLSARDVRENDVEFIKSWTFFFNNNGAVSWGKDTSDGLWERLSTIDFGEGIDRASRRDNWSELLKSEAPGILQWMIDGCAEWQEMGLQEPLSVSQEGEERRIDADPLVVFVEERYERVASGEVAASTFMEQYTEWCKRTGEAQGGGRNTVYNDLRNRLGLVMGTKPGQNKQFIFGLKVRPLTFEDTLEMNFN